jgi:hypothetical protein
LGENINIVWESREDVLHTDKEVGIEVTAGETEVYVNACSPDYMQNINII